MTTEELRDEAVQLAINWAKTGNGYLSMRNRFNQYAEQSGANKACNNNEEAILYGRKISVNDIVIRALRSLGVQQSIRLSSELMKIAEEDIPTQHRGMHR